MAAIDVQIASMWIELLEKDDRTSPVEHPDMLLLAFDEFEGYLKEIAARFPAENSPLSPSEASAGNAGLDHKNPPPPEAVEAELVEGLREAKLQIEYLNEKYRQTGSGAATVARIDAILAHYDPAPRSDAHG